VAGAQERTMTEEMQLIGNAFDNRLTYQGGAYYGLNVGRSEINVGLNALGNRIDFR